MTSLRQRAIDVLVAYLDRVAPGGPSCALHPNEAVDALIAAGLIREPISKPGRPRSFDWAEAERLRSTGLTYQRIAEKLGVSRSTVYAAIKAQREAGNE